MFPSPGKRKTLRDVTGTLRSSYKTATKKWQEKENKQALYILKHENKESATEVAVIEFK